MAGIQPGAWYRFAAHYQSTGGPYESLQILARIDWRTANGKRVGPPEYVYKTERAGDWVKTSTEVQAPEKAAVAALQLFLFNAPQGTIRWDEISLQRISPPGPRPVTVAAINLEPHNTKTSAESVTQFLDAIARAIPGKTDVILLPEGITVIGTGKKYVEVAEPVRRAM